MNQTTKQLIAVQLIKCLYLQLDRFPQKFDTNFEAILYEQFLNSFSQKTAKVSFAVTIATPNFINELEFLSDNRHKTTKKTEYLALLEKWFLYQEKEMIEKENQILSLLNNKTLQNIFTQNCFKNGEYKLERVRTLLALLS